MAKVIDPDQLTRGTEIVFNNTDRTIQLIATGNLDVADGVTLQAVYSFCKEEWKDDATLIKLPFPMEAITEVKFDLINGWDWYAVTSVTKELIRDGGWAVRDAGGVSTEEYLGFITLGLMDDPALDNAYYQQVAGSTAATTETVYPGPVNEPVQIWDNTTSLRTFFTAFLREQGKVYAQSSLAEQAVNNIDYTVYKLPLANATDPKIVATDIQIESTGVLQGVYAGMTIDYLRGTGFTAWISAGTYVIDQVVSNGGRWFRSLTNHNGVATFPGVDATNWVAYIGEREIGAAWYPFKVIIDGDLQLAEKIYEFTQYRNRQALDINDNTLTDAFGAVNGNIAPQLLSFLGDTLVTGVGVFIDFFNSNDTNRIEFRDATATTQTFPFVAAGTINFNDNLQNDDSSKYWMFFNTLPQNIAPGDQNYGTVGAIIVKDNTGTDITGLISAAPSVSFTFDYDGNVQGGRTAELDAEVVIVANGLTTAQFVRVNGTITRNVGINFSLVSALERNYSNPV